jgi:L-alanine-DL-glutamate epimerase-like enolase superfamily enzyme
VGHLLDWAAKEVAGVEPAAWEAFLDHVHEDVCGNPSARAALDLAVHDLVGKLQGVPVRALYGLPAARLETCMTVSLDAPEAMAAEAKEYRARGFRVLKLKLGQAAGDLARLDAVRAAVPDARLRADANTGWTLAETKALLPELARRRVEFVEQPVPPARTADLVEASRASPLPVYADESVMDARDVRALHDAGFRGGMNLKLQKTGGIRPAVAALREAKRLGHAVQLGCNVETAVGIAGGVQLLSLLDHADLDGHLLLADEPFLGPRPVEGWYETPDAPGLGVRLNA